MRRNYLLSNQKSLSTDYIHSGCLGCNSTHTATTDILTS